MLFLSQVSNLPTWDQAGAKKDSRKKLVKIDNSISKNQASLSPLLYLNLILNCFVDKALAQVSGIRILGGQQLNHKVNIRIILIFLKVKETIN